MHINRLDLYIFRLTLFGILVAAGGVCLSIILVDIVEQLRNVSGVANANTFTALTDEEAESCIDDRCYIAQMEQNMASPSCGMPQFEDYALDSCDMESYPHNGLFVQAANPDGVIFSFRDKV